MSTPLRLAAALLVPLLLLTGCGDDEPNGSGSTSEPSSEQSSEPTDEATAESTEATESAESAYVGGDRCRLGPARPLRRVRHSAGR